jgi:hypothetical protein
MERVRDVFLKGSKEASKRERKRDLLMLWNGMVAITSSSS